MKFRSQFSDRVPVVSNSGTSDRIIYEGRYAPDGSFDLEPTGREDLYSYIQSHRDSVDIHVLISRYGTDDPSLFSRRQGFFADISDFPSTYAEVLQSIHTGEAVFNQLPVEVKRSYDNSFSKWLASFGTPEFAASLGFGASVPDDPAPAPAPAPVSASTSTPTPVSAPTPAPTPSS